MKQIKKDIIKSLSTHGKDVGSTEVQIGLLSRKIEKLSEMLCNVETIKTIKESHVLSLLRYFDLIA